MNKTLLIFGLAGILFMSSCSIQQKTIDTPDPSSTTAPITATEAVMTTMPVGVFEQPTFVFEPVQTTTIREPHDVSEEDIKLLALVTMAEAEAEPELGKRLVIDVILNRVDSEHFPNTIRDVIYQPNQFTCMWNNRIDRCEVRDDIIRLVREELENRTNYHVIFFRTGDYHSYGTPMFSIGNHYFSEY